MSSVNKAIIVGRVGKDTELRYTQSGDAVANFTVATSKRWKDSNGVQQDKTEWHNIVAFKKLAEICGQYVKKGGQVYIEGEITTRKWTDKSGNDRYTTEIVCAEMKMLGSRGDTGGEPAQSNAPRQQKPAAPVDEWDSDIPFN